MDKSLYYFHPALLSSYSVYKLSFFRIFNIKPKFIDKPFDISLCDMADDYYEFGVLGQLDIQLSQTL